MSCFLPLCFNIGSYVPWDLSGLNFHYKLLVFVLGYQIGVFFGDRNGIESWSIDPELSLPGLGLFTLFP